MQDIKLTDIDWATKNIDHHGIVAGCCHDLDIAEMIDQRLYREAPLDSRRPISGGLATVAMIINGLGFTNRRLYLASQFFETKPVGLLLNKPNLTAENITDDTLGHALDEIAEYGAEKLFGSIATEIALKHKLIDRLFHVDTTSIATTGEYADIDENSEYVKVAYGKSKDNRPDCKQIIMSLVVNGGNGIPLWMSPRAGNASDKKILYETIKTVKEFCAEIDIGNKSKWVADAALYNQNNLLQENSFTWLSRVPETITQAKELIQTPRSGEWQTHEKGYASFMIKSNYGGIDQKWLLVYSEESFKRELKTFNKNLQSQKEQLTKDLWHFSNETFTCEIDLIKALEKIKKRYKYFKVDGVIEKVRKYAKPGKPRANELQQTIGYKYNSNFEEDFNSINAELTRKGKFILATNDLDSNYDNYRMLTDYKAQQKVEQGFRFLKDPWFMVKSIFLKSTKRITALMMIMALCLFIYNFAQHKLRRTLIEKNETLPSQLNKPIQNPTMRWIFQIMEGVHMVYVRLKDTNKIIKEQVSNLNEIRHKIVLLFGGYACKVYGLNNK